MTDRSPNPNGITISPAELRRIADFVHRTYGLNMPEGKQRMVEAQISRLLTSLHIGDASRLCHLLSADPDGPEGRALVSALTTNVTHFFREEHHFTLLAQHLRQHLTGQRRIRLWSAGCSAGQEAYSMAMTVLEQRRDSMAQDIRILATDIDSAILSRAKAGEYSSEECASLPQRHRMYLRKLSEDRLTMAPEVMTMIHHAELNLVADWPMRGNFDAIFCRNVAIYFDKPTQARLWLRLAARLEAGGILCIGHSESLHGPAREVMSSTGVTGWRLNAPPAEVRRRLLAYDAEVARPAPSLTRQDKGEAA